jgi:hypothetical protein
VHWCGENNLQLDSRITGGLLVSCLGGKLKFFFWQGWKDF